MILKKKRLVRARRATCDVLRNRVHRHRHRHRRHRVIVSSHAATGRTEIRIKN